MKLGKNRAAEAAVKAIEKPMLKRVQLDIPAEQHAKFKALCSLKGVTMSEVMIDAVNEFVNTNSIELTK